MVLAFKMSGWSYAFSLSKDEVFNSEPPGTVKLMGKSNVGVDDVE